MNDEINSELKNFKLILNEVGAYIYTKDINGCYTYANKLVLELFNFPLIDVVGKDDTHFFDLTLSKELIENDKKVLIDGEIIEIEEKNIIKSTGEIKIYWTVKKPLFDETGKINGMIGISTDITERKLLENKVLEQKYLLDTILNNVDAYIYMKDENRIFRYVNLKVAELFGKSVDEIIGKKDIDVLPLEIANTFWELDKKVFDSNEKQAAEESIKDDDGNTMYYWSVKLPFLLNNKEKTLIGFSSDITEIHNLREKLIEQSITDSLTSLYNRRYFNDTCISEFKRSKRYSMNFSMIIMDIDHFKKINDTYGHPVGDLVLKDISNIAKTFIRKEDTLCRIGGEEFAIILPHTNLQDAIELSERIRKNQENTLIKVNSDTNIKVTFSIGISTIDSLDNSYEDMFLRADKALYKAKEQGRNIVFF